MSLHDTDTVIPVDDKARKSVAFTVDQTEAVCEGIGSETGRFTYLEGTGNHSSPEIRSQDILARETEYPYRNGSYLVMAICQERAVICEDSNYITLGRVPNDLGDRTGENPRMEAAQRLLPTLL
jgi:hypothetical protein